MTRTLQYLVLAVTLSVAASFENGMNGLNNGEAFGSISGSNRIQIGNITTITNSSRPSRSTWCNLEWCGNNLCFSTPDYGIQNYPNNADCSLWGSSGPVMAEFTLEPFDLQRKVNGKCRDYFQYPFPYGVTKRWCGIQKKKFKTPTYNFEAKFISDDTITRPGFRISIRFIYDSPCHTYYGLYNIGDSVEFSTPNYPNLDTEKNRMCEVWVYSYYRVQADFLDFDLKPPCSKNNVVVNLDANSYYPQATSYRYCGSSLPPSTVSSWSYSYYMLVYQANKHNKGFRVRFTAVY